MSYLNMAKCCRGLKDTMLVAHMGHPCPSETSMYLCQRASPSTMATPQTAEKTHPSLLGRGLEKEGERQLAKRDGRAQSSLWMQTWVFL